jgi:hypothetical protein
MSKFYHIPPHDLDPFIKAISHGGEEHREWLKESVYNYFFYNHPIQPVRGTHDLNKFLENELPILKKRLSKTEVEDFINKLAEYE